MNRRSSNRFFIGFMLIGLGLLFLMQQLGYVTWDIGELFRKFWPVFMIYVGLHGLFAQRVYSGRGGSYIWNLFIVFLGGMFLAKNLGILGNLSYGDLFKFSGPGILILIGLSMLFKPSRMSGKRDYRYEYKYGDHNGSGSTAYDPGRKIPHPDELSGTSDIGAQPSGETREERRDARRERWQERRERREERWGGFGEHSHTSWSGKENHSSFFGDLHLGHDYWELKPMNISHFIGDTILDLTTAQIPYGETKINVSAFIGDVKIFIPNDMQVEVSVISSSFLGDIRVFDRHESGLMRNLRLETANYGDADKKIKLVVSMFIGDVKVQKVG